MHAGCRVFLYILLVILELFDFFSDWMFFAEMKTAKRGLVYGPPDEKVVNGLLAFAIIGSFCFIFDLLNLWMEKFSGKKAWVDTTKLSAIILWIEDVPQIIISFVIARCREDPSSVFQLIKAGLVFLDLLIHISVAIYEFRMDRVKSKIRKFCWGSIALGMLINTALAIAVFIFTQGHLDTNNSIKVHRPKSLFKDTYNNQRYFQNVSAFLHLPDFAASTPSQSTGSEWVRLTSINDILNLDDAVMGFNLVHEKTNTHVRMALYKENKAENNQKDDWQLSGCYQTELATRTMTSVNESTCRGASFFSNNRTSMYIGFSFANPDSIVFKERIFGEIYYNIKVFNNGQCTDLTTPPAIHYYRVNATISNNDAKDLLMEGSKPRFYRSNTNDLQDVSEVWRTGFNRQCESSGSLAPVLDMGVTVDCSNTGVYYQFSAPYGFLTNQDGF